MIAPPGAGSEVYRWIGLELILTKVLTPLWVRLMKNNQPNYL